MLEQVVSVDGIEYYTLLEGPANGRYVVLCHALMSNLHIWDSTVLALHAVGFRTIRFDHIGHGLTPPPRKTRQFHFDDFTRHIHQIAAVLMEKQQPLYGIVGCSMGGVLAIRYALMYPGCVSKIVSCEAPGMTSLEVSKPKWRQRINHFQKEGVDDLAVATVDRWFPDPCEPSIRTHAVEIVRTCCFEGYKICADAIMNYDYTNKLGDIDGEQVLVMCGENDEAIWRKEVLMDIADRIKGARYVEMAQTGHIPPMHRSSEFEKILIGFLES